MTATSHLDAVILLKGSITCRQSDRMDCLSVFYRVVVVNLARRPERMEMFWRSLPVDWPLRWPERFEAVDGQTVEVPAEWLHGPGAWGCMLSHRQVLREAIADGLDSIL